MIQINPVSFKTEINDVPAPNAQRFVAVHTTTCSTKPSKLATSIASILPVLSSRLIPNGHEILTVESESSKANKSASSYDIFWFYTMVMV